MALEASSVPNASSNGHSTEHNHHETDGLIDAAGQNEKQVTQDIRSLCQQYTRRLAITITRPLSKLFRNLISPFPASPESSKAVAAKSNPDRASTAYLDGLRGFAALSVVFVHVQEWTQEDYDQNLKKIRMPYGWEGNHLLVCWPLFRIFVSAGGFGIALFFIMSGYVLSKRPYKLIMIGETHAFTKSISSALFRRWFRLFLPIFAVNFLWVSSWYLGIYRSARPEHDHKPHHDTWTGELTRLYNVMSELSSLFGEKDRERFRIYNPVIWTIAKEFRGSIVVYLTMTAFAQFTWGSRLFGEIILCLYLWHLKFTSLALFVAGMIVCHVDTLNQTAAPFKLPRMSPSVDKWSWLLWYVPFLLGIYLGGTSSIVASSIEAWYQVHAVSALLMLISISRIPWCKSALETRFCQWLGWISYSLYLTHLPNLWMIGARIYAFFGRFRGKPEFYGAWANVMPLPAYGPIGLEVNVVVPTVFFLLLAGVVAELSTRFIDEPSVKLAQWLYRKGTTTWQDGSKLLPVQIDSRPSPAGSCSQTAP